MTGTTDVFVSRRLPEGGGLNPVGSSPQGKASSLRNTQYRQWLACISATLTMVIVGTVYGWTTTSLLHLTSGTGGVPLTLTHDESSWVVSLTVLGSMIGSLVAAQFADRRGRKRCLLLCCSIFTLGWFIIYVATSVLSLYFARVILGIGVGIAYTINPMYVSEVADINIRGAIGTLIAVNVFTGSLLTCSLGLWLAYKSLLTVLVIISVISFLLNLCFPETPYFLVAKGRNKQARKSITYYKGIVDPHEMKIALRALRPQTRRKLQPQTKSDLSSQSRNYFTSQSGSGFPSLSLRDIHSDAIWEVTDTEPMPDLHLPFSSDSPSISVIHSEVVCDVHQPPIDELRLQPSHDSLELPLQPPRELPPPSTSEGHPPSSSKIHPEPTSEIQPEPTSEIQPEPTSEIQPEPTSEIQPESTSEIQPESTSEIQPESTSEIQPEPTSEIQPEPTSEIQPEPTSEIQPEPTSEIQSEPTSEIQPEPTSETQPEPTREIQPEPTSEIQPEPTREIQPEPTREIQPEPTSEIQPEPVSEIQSEPTSETQPEPTSEIQPEPTSEIQPEPTREIQSEPTSEIQPEPTSETQPEPTSEIQPEPTSEIQPEPTSEIQPEPTREIQPEPTREIQPEPTREIQPEPTSDLPSQSSINFPTYSRSDLRAQSSVDSRRSISSNEVYVEVTKQTWITKLRVILQRSNRKALFIMLGLIMAQQLSGNFITMQYLEVLFSETTVGIEPNVATILVLAVGLISGSLSTLTVEYLGRRTLLILSTLGSCFTLSILATYLLLVQQKFDVSIVSILPVIDLILYQVMFQIGLGTIPNVLLCELFPTEIKGFAGAIIVIFDGIIGFTVSKLYQVITDTVGSYSIYLIFASSCSLAFLMVYIWIPETKGKTYHEIEALLVGNNVNSSKEDVRIDRRDIHIL